MYMKILEVTRNKEMLGALDLLGLQGTVRHPGILDVEDTQVNAFLRIQSNLPIGKLHYGKTYMYPLLQHYWCCKVKQ